MTEAISHRVSKEIWRVYEYVIMPSHLHLFVEPLTGELLDLLKEFKRWTGHQAAKALGRVGERFWADEWFDHWARSSGHGEKIVQYLRENPVKAGLVKDFSDWPYGSWNVWQGPSRQDGPT